jgi:geranylgeranyl diphosphate synthase, type II
VGRDVALGLPSAAIELGLGGALAHFRELIARASASIPDCAGAEALRQIVQAESLRLIPVAMAEALLQRAAVSAAVAS